MSKTDLQARPIYHHLRDSIETHVTIVFAALAISHWIEQTTGWSIRKFVRTARRYRTIEIQAGAHTITAADPLPDDLRHALDQINHTDAHYSGRTRVIHVLKYLWGAAWCLHEQNDGPAAEARVARHAQALLAGQVLDVAAALDKQVRAARRRHRPHLPPTARYRPSQQANPSAPRWGWCPVQSALIPDLEEGHYFNNH